FNRFWTLASGSGCEEQRAIGCAMALCRGRGGLVALREALHATQAARLLVFRHTLGRQRENLLAGTSMGVSEREPPEGLTPVVLAWPLAWSTCKERAVIHHEAVEVRPLHRKGGFRDQTARTAIIRVRDGVAIGVGQGRD